MDFFSFFSHQYSTYHILHKGQISPQGRSQEGGGVYEQTDAKLPITVKAKSALRNSDTLPSKGLRWPENEQLILSALYFTML